MGEDDAARRESCGGASPEEPVCLPAIDETPRPINTGVESPVTGADGGNAGSSPAPSRVGTDGGSLLTSSVGIDGGSPPTSSGPAPVSPSPTSTDGPDAEAPPRSERWFDGTLEIDCEVAGRLEMQVDETAPTFDIVDEALVAFSPLTFVLHEPIHNDVRWSLTGQDGQTIEARHGGSGVGPMAFRMSLTPYSGWPSGTVTLEVEGMTDAAGNVAEDISVSFEVPEYISATEDPSFESGFDEPGPWLSNSCTRAEALEYRDWSSDMDVSLPPTNGAALAVCRGNGLLLQAFIVPPEGATTVLIDAGSINLSTAEAGELTLRLVQSGEENTMTLDQADTAPTAPGFRTYSGLLDEAADGVWLIVEAENGSYEDGSSAGAAFLDNLRFE